DLILFAYSTHPSKLVSLQQLVWFHVCCQMMIVVLLLLFESSYYHQAHAHSRYLLQVQPDFALPSLQWLVYHVILSPNPQHDFVISIALLLGLLLDSKAPYLLRHQHCPTRFSPKTLWIPPKLENPMQYIMVASS